jgi:hypothetical protein
MILPDGRIKRHNRMSRGVNGPLIHPFIAFGRFLITSPP